MNHKGTKTQRERTPHPGLLPVGEGARIRIGDVIAVLFGLGMIALGVTVGITAEQNRISDFRVTPAPACTNRMNWYAGTNGTYCGSHLGCCYQLSLTWNTVTGRTYQVVYGTWDTTGGEFSTWNACSPPIAGTGSKVTFSTGAPEPSLAFYTVQEW